MVAPGVTVMSAKAGTISSYVAYSGTSMATPFVAGVVALGLEAAPNATPAAVKSALQVSAHDAGKAGPDYDWGHGLVDARAFIDALKGNSPITTAAWPDRQLVAGSVGGTGSTDIPITITTAGKPLGLSMRLDGSQGCLLPVGNECWLPGEWSPDLDAVCSTHGLEVAQSQCPLSDDGVLQPVGRW